jgi:hypothetical protein
MYEVLDVHVGSAVPQVAAHKAAIVVLLHPDHAPTPEDAEALKAAAGASARLCCFVGCQHA